MKITKYHQHFALEVFEDNSYTLNSSDNIRACKNFYALDPHASFQYSCNQGVLVFENDNEISNAILCGEGGATSVHETSTFIYGDSIYICIGNAIASLEIPDLTLNWIKKVDDAAAFQIFNLRDGIIVHGEMSISRLKMDGTLVWQKYGSDIFVTPNGDMDFEISNDKIYAQSWDGRKYVFHFDESGDLF